ncbi:hypothetical protein Tco_0486600 [Tanacetum coccineum]
MWSSCSILRRYALVVRGHGRGRGPWPEVRGHDHGCGLWSVVCGPWSVVRGHGHGPCPINVVVVVLSTVVCGLCAVCVWSVRGCSGGRGHGLGHGRGCGRGHGPGRGRDHCHGRGHC